MAKRRTYEEKLLDDLNTLPANKWFKINDRPEFEKITAAVKGFISIGEQFEFSNDYTKIKRISEDFVLPVYHLMKKLPSGITVIPLLPGEKIYVTVKNKTVMVEREKKAWSICHNGKEFSIET